MNPKRERLETIAGAAKVVTGVPVPLLQEAKVGLFRVDAVTSSN